MSGESKESGKGRNIGGKPEEIQIDFERLKELNADSTGWIMFYGRHVNYPLVQTDDNSYYLNHSFKREKMRRAVFSWTAKINSLKTEMW